MYGVFVYHPNIWGGGGGGAGSGQIQRQALAILNQSCFPLIAGIAGLWPLPRPHLALEACSGEQLPSFMWLSLMYWLLAFAFCLFLICFFCLFVVCFSLFCVLSRSRTPHNIPSTHNNHHHYHPYHLHRYGTFTDTLDKDLNVCCILIHRLGGAGGERRKEEKRKWVWPHHLVH